MRDVLPPSVAPVPLRRSPAPNVALAPTASPYAGELRRAVGPAGILALQRAGGNRAATALVRRDPPAPAVARAGRADERQAPVQRQAPAHRATVRLSPFVVGPAATSTANPVSSVQREPVSAAALVAWCLTGAATTLALDLVAQNIDAVMARVRRAAELTATSAPMVVGPTLALGASGGYRGAMERDRRRLMAGGRGAAPVSLPQWRFNKCSALLSVMVGCVFGVAGGAVRTMLVQAGRWTGRGLLELVKKAGYEQAMGKWGLIIAKMGCEDRPLDGVQGRSASEVRPQLADLVGERPRSSGGESDGAAASEDGGVCEAPPAQTSSEPEELVCRAP